MKQILITWQMGPKIMFVKSISCKNCQTHLFKMKQHVCPTESWYKAFSINISSLQSFDFSCFLITLSTYIIPFAFVHFKRLNSNNKPVHSLLIDSNATNYIVFKTKNRNNLRNNQFNLKVVSQFEKLETSVSSSFVPNIHNLKKVKNLASIKIKVK